MEFMQHPTSRELYDYWNDLRGSRPAPRRTEVEPSSIRRILADTFMLEVLEGARYIVRLAGTRMCAVYGREVKNRDFLGFWSADDRPAVANLMAAVAEDAAGGLMIAHFHSEGGQSVACEIVLLPLHQGGRTYDRLLGSCATLEQPSWLGNDPVSHQRVVSLRLLWPEDPAPPAKTGTDGAALAPQTGRRVRLQVLKGGRE